MPDRGAELDRGCTGQSAPAMLPTGVAPDTHSWSNVRRRGASSGEGTWGIESRLTGSSLGLRRRQSPAAAPDRPPIAGRSARTPAGHARFQRRPTGSSVATSTSKASMPSPGRAQRARICRGPASCGPHHCPRVTDIRAPHLGGPRQPDLLGLASQGVCRFHCRREGGHGPGRPDSSGCALMRALTTAPRSPSTTRSGPSTSPTIRV